MTEVTLFILAWLLAIAVIAFITQLLSLPHWATLIVMALGSYWSASALFTCWIKWLS